MPFKKAKGGGYKSPSGRKFTKKQVALYYATGGFKRRKATTGGTKHVLAHGKSAAGGLTSSGA